MRTKRPARAGITIIELLVVLSVMALLFSIVLPAMSGSERTSERVACMGTLREIAKGARMYAMLYDNWIIGAPSGSGAYLQGAVMAHGPAVQNWDFMGPMAYIWRMSLPMGSGDTGGVVKRFNALRGHPAFSCASNDFLSMKYSASSGPDAGSGPMVSYNTVRYQLWREEEAPSNHNEKLPMNWRPSVGRIGNPANKVFCADGSRYATVNQVPDYDLEVNSPFGGAFSDAGAYSTNSRSWDRSRAPGNGHTGPIDARMYAFRHSISEPPVGAPGNAYKLNLAFYDGHVETQGDLDATNPHQWLPIDTILETSGSHGCWPDTIDHFGLPPELVIGP